MKSLFFLFPHLQMKSGMNTSHRFFQQNRLIICSKNFNHDYEYFLFSYEYTFAGFAGIHEENGSLFLSKLYVHKDFRGKKIASYMFRKFIEICKMRNLNKIWLTCNRFNESTLAVYEHLGFQKVRTEVTDIGQGYVMDDYILEYKVE